jgi:hypothetical protein
MNYSINLAVALTTGILFFTSCHNSASKEITQVAAAEPAEPQLYQVKEEEVVLYDGPGESYKKIINKKATEALKETHYCNVDKTVKFITTESKGTWTKIKVVEPAWLSDSHTGWIPTKNIVKEGEQPTPPVIPRKLQAFNDVTALVESLSQIGIGRMRPWRKEEGLGYFSATDYFRFGEAGGNGLENNLACYLESESEEHVEKLQLVLNIFNSAERSNALKLFGATAKKTFQSINLPLPAGRLSNFTSARSFKHNAGSADIQFEREKNNIETWKLVIVSK